MEAITTELCLFPTSIIIIFRLFVIFFSLQDLAFTDVFQITSHLNILISIKYWIASL